MTKEQMQKTINKLLDKNGIILSIDECPFNIQNKFDRYNINNTEETRRRYRSMIIETEGLEKYVNGIMLNRETFWQRNDEDVYLTDIIMKKNILIGIRLDDGLKDMRYGAKTYAEGGRDYISERMPDDLKNDISSGKDNVMNFLKKQSGQTKQKLARKNHTAKQGAKGAEYVQEKTQQTQQQPDNKKEEPKTIKDESTKNVKENKVEKIVDISNTENYLKSGEYENAAFAKCRVVLFISDAQPTSTNVDENTTKLAEFAKLCISYDMVAILEVEVDINGDYTIEQSHQIYKYFISMLLHKLSHYDVDISMVLIKMGFITDGKLRKIVNVDETTHYFENIVMNVVPVMLSGIVFMSGGHSLDNIKNYIKSIKQKITTPKIGLSLCRAVTDGALKEWNGNDNNAETAQKCLIEDLKQVSNL